MLVKLTNFPAWESCRILTPLLGKYLQALALGLRLIFISGWFFSPIFFHHPVFLRTVEIFI